MEPMPQEGVLAESMNHVWPLLTTLQCAVYPKDLWFLFLCYGSVQVDAEMVCHPIPQRGLDQVHLELQFGDFPDLPFAAEYPNIQEICHLTQFDGVWAKVKVSEIRWKKTPSGTGELEIFALQSIVTHPRWSQRHDSFCIFPLWFMQRWSCLSMTM